MEGAQSLVAVNAGLKIVLCATVYGYLITYIELYGF